MKSYWHFAAIDEQGRPVMRDGTIIKVGRRYEVSEAIVCRCGFHGSPSALDALQYAPGPWVSKRPIEGITERLEDKVVGTAFVQQPGIDTTEVLEKFARLCALDVIDKWDAPDVVVRYLKTGDESIRAAAWDAAWAATWDATWDAGRSAARDATRAAAWAAARDATRTAARVAARDAARAAARVAARDAQRKRLDRMLNQALRESRRE